MKIRSYEEDKDFERLKGWIDDERIHAFWCADCMAYPVRRTDFREILERSAKDWGSRAYVAEEDEGAAVGFFCCSFHSEDKSGFLNLVIIAPEKRGGGYGSKMLHLALSYLFSGTEATLIRLNVFDENRAAKRCYEKVGFVTEKTEKDIFSYKEELWSRCRMSICREVICTDEILP